MPVPVVRRHHLVVCTLAALPFLAGCAADAPFTAPEPAVRASVQSFTLAGTDFLVAGAPVGSFGAFVVNNSGRATTEFWDNLSADRPAAGTASQNCNVGHWASGTFSTTCENDAPGSDVNIPAAGTWTRYWGDGPQSRDPSAFMFTGAHQYKVRLLASYAGNSSVVGYYTRIGGSYQFTPVAPWGLKTIGTEVTIPAGADWGLFIGNRFNPDLAGCGTGPNGERYYCSDANGGFTPTTPPVPLQQHALFTNGAGSAFLVGMEDNSVETLPEGTFYDSDYQDYIFRIEPVVAPGGGPVGGCSPGFWRNQRGDAWPGGYSPNTLFTAVFGEGANPEAFAGRTLHEVLTQGGGGLTALGRHTVSALLNAATPNGVMNYELTPQQVIDKFKAVYPGGDYGALADEFEALQDENGRVCTVPRVNVNGGGGRRR